MMSLLGKDIRNYLNKYMDIYRPNKLFYSTATRKKCQRKNHSSLIKTSS